MEYLLCLKGKLITLTQLPQIVKYPGSILLLRGNHESRQCTQVYGFYEEIQRKYGNTSPWRMFMELFDCIPLAGLIESIPETEHSHKQDRVLCVHGGLSPDIRAIDQIRTIDRRVEIPHEGPFCDLMWSDPEDIEYWNINTRGAGFMYYPK
jgi:serine/threonine-protein phosphatase 6 catalytic subunit